MLVILQAIVMVLWEFRALVKLHFGDKHTRYDLERPYLVESKAYATQKTFSALIIQTLHVLATSRPQERDHYVCWVTFRVSPCIKSVSNQDDE